MIDFLYEYSGLKFVVLKFIGKKPNHPDFKEPPSGMVWLVGVYFAVYGLALQIHRNDVADAEEQGNPHWLTYDWHSKKDSSLCYLTTRLYNRTLRINQEPLLLQPTSSLDILFGPSVGLFVMDYETKDKREEELQYALVALSDSCATKETPKGSYLFPLRCMYEEASIKCGHMKQAAQ